MELILKLLALLPLTWIHALGRLMGTLIYRCSPSYRARIKENLQIAGIYSSELGRRVAKEQGAQALEAPWVWGQDKQDVIRRCHVDEQSRAVLKKAIDANQAIVFFTPHIGCYEVAPLWVADHMLKDTDRNIAILYRVPRKAYLRKFVGEGRATEHILPAPADLKGIRMILKTLKAGGMAGILPDQVPSNGEGVWANFFSRPAYTMTFPIRLIRQFKAQLLVARVERIHGGWNLYVRSVEEDFSQDDATAAQQMNKIIEQTVLECPSQYLWSYNRYKCPSGVKRPE